jgi:glycosyltransferase involved in cell wall biosynthesis
MPQLTIGYLHLQPPGSADQEHGVTRYGRLLAGQVAQCPETIVQSVSVDLADNNADNNADGNIEADRANLRAAAASLRQADLVHIQYSKYLWADPQGNWGADRLFAFLDSLTNPVVVTLHDVDANLYGPGQLWRGLVQQWQKQRRFSKGRSLALRSTWLAFRKSTLADSQTLQRLLQRSASALVCHQAEADRLRHLPGQRRIQVMPHFIEGRSIDDRPIGERQQGLGLSGPVITLQGYLYPGKGHRILLDAVAQLAAEIPSATLVFAGGPSAGSESLQRSLETQAAELGLSDRLRITGYLDEATLIQYLQATDIAVCPFEKLSASGSIATWIALGKQPLASDLPQIRELNGLVAGAIETFSPYDATTLAAAIRQRLARHLAQPTRQATAVMELRSRLSLAAIGDRHRQLYAGLVKRSVN